MFRKQNHLAKKARFIYILQTKLVYIFFQVCLEIKCKRKRRYYFVNKIHVDIGKAL